jgi:hypothetical protein
LNQREKKIHIHKSKPKLLQSKRRETPYNLRANPKQNTMKSVSAATVDNGDSIPKEGEATFGARQPISLQTAPTKRSRLLIKKIFSN